MQAKEMNLERENEQQLEEDIKAQALIWKYIYGFAESLTLKCAVELGIPEILHNNNGLMNLSQLSEALKLASPNMDRLRRIMRYLVHMKLFTVNIDKDGEEEYGLTAASNLLIKGQKKSLVSYTLQQLHCVEIPIWYHLSACVEGEKTPWMACHGVSPYEKLAEDSMINKLFNDAMTDHTNCMVPALVEGFKSERVFEGVRSLVDVGGNSGVVAMEIVEAFPHVKCSVMDIPQVIEKVPKDPKIEFVAGDMFNFVPHGDAILMKSILHGFNDEDCVKILSKCKEAISPTDGKVILVEIVVDAENLPEFSSARISMDMEMMMFGGKERTKDEWENLLHKAEFTRYKIIHIMAMESIIEAYP